MKIILWAVIVPTYVYFVLLMDTGITQQILQTSE